MDERTEGFTKGLEWGKTTARDIITDVGDEVIGMYSDKTIQDAVHKALEMVRTRLK